jgi:hypothetical protein
VNFSSNMWASTFTTFILSGKAGNGIYEARIGLGVIHGTAHMVIRRKSLQGYDHGNGPLA